LGLFILKEQKVVENRTILYENATISHKSLTAISSKNLDAVALYLSKEGIY